MATTTSTVKDPVCGMQLDPRQAEERSDFEGQTYYFCSPGCKEEFDEDPEEYVA